jgi:hypothetical protein
VLRRACAPVTTSKIVAKILSRTGREHESHSNPNYGADAGESHGKGRLARGRPAGLEAEGGEHIVAVEVTERVLQSIESHGGYLCVMGELPTEDSAEVGLSPRNVVSSVRLCARSGGTDLDMVHW